MSSFEDIVIAGTGKALPPLTFSNEDMVAWHGHKHSEWFFERIGVRSRHSFYDFARNRASDEDEDDLAVKACTDALAVAEIGIEDVGAILFTTSTPTHNVFPDSACTLHSRLRASMDTPALTLSSGCCGTLNGVMLAKALIKGGQADSVLVCSASSMTSYFRPHLKEKVWLHSCIFGDGVSAIVVKKASASQEARGFGAFFLGADPSSDVATKTWGGSKRPPEPHNIDEVLNDHLRINFKAVPTNIGHKLDYVLKRVTTATNTQPLGIDWVLVNQANAVHQRKWIAKAGFTQAQGFSNMEKLGNCAAASLGLVLHDFIQQQKPKRGDIALIMSVGTGLQYGGALYKF